MEFIILSGLFLVFFILERILPQVDTAIVGKYHDASNIGLGTINLLAGRSFATLTVFTLANFLSTKELGILNILELDYKLKIFIGIISLDCLNYWWHRLVHKVSFLWKFHNIHHTDRLLNVSSALRFHLLEVLIGYLFKLPFLLLMGIPVKALIFYEVILNSNVYFHHSNIKINRKLDLFISNIIVTPYIHRIHHSLRLKKSYNFSSVLVFWDKIFGSFYPQEEISTPKYGVSGFSDSKYQSFLYMLKQPFIEK